MEKLSWWSKMKTIRISEEVWNEIARRGAFGETPDIVLRRVFQINQPLLRKSALYSSTSKRSRYATDRMSANIEGDRLAVMFHSGPVKEFKLPDRSNKREIANLTSNVMEFVKQNGGTIGQINAARKALTDAGYRIMK
jgi:hypothetical protein